MQVLACTCTFRPRRTPPTPKPNVKSPSPHPKNDGKTGTGKTPYKPPFKKHLVVSEDHRALVGYPRGKPSNTNPAGYSLNSSHPSGHCSPLMLMDGQLETQTTSVVMQVSLILSGSMCLSTTDTFVVLDEQLAIWCQCIRQYTTWISLLSSRI